MSNRETNEVLLTVVALALSALIGFCVGYFG